MLEDTDIERLAEEKFPFLPVDIYPISSSYNREQLLRREGYKAALQSLPVSEVEVCKYCCECDGKCEAFKDGGHPCNAIYRKNVCPCNWDGVVHMDEQQWQQLNKKEKEECIKIWKIQAGKKLGEAIPIPVSDAENKSYGTKVLNNLLDRFDERNENGMPIAKYVHRKTGHTTTYLRYDAVVKEINSIVKNSDKSWIEWYKENWLKSIKLWQKEVEEKDKEIERLSDLLKKVFRNNTNVEALQFRILELEKQATIK